VNKTKTFSRAVQLEIAALAGLLEQFGSHCRTVNGESSLHSIPNDPPSFSSAAANQGRARSAFTQERMAELMGVEQENVSRLERRADLLLSTLSSYVAAMGGKLRLVAEFPCRHCWRGTAETPAAQRRGKEAISKNLSMTLLA
jgi:hypothetical protein